MKHTTILLSSLLSLFLTACATGTHINKTNNLISLFEQYQRVADKSNDEQKKYFTPKMWNTLQEYRSNPKNKINSIVNVANNFPFELTKLESSQEKIENGKGCLVVHGVDHKNQPMDYLVEFVKQDDTWVMDNYETFIYDDSERWLTEPECDPEKRQELFMKHFQAAADK